MLLCQQNLEYVESEFLTSALIILANSHQFLDNPSLENGSPVQLTSNGRRKDGEDVKR